MPSLAKRLRPLARNLRGIWAIPAVRLAALVSLSVILFSTLPTPVALGALIFVVFTAYNLSSKYLSILSLVFLSSIPILLYFGYEGIGEELAVYVYFLLILVVSLELKSYLVENLVKFKPQEPNPSSSESESFFVPAPTSPQTLASEPTWTNEPAFRQELRRELPKRSKVAWERVLRAPRGRIPSGNLAVLGLFAALSLLFFNFSGLPYFRDLTTLPFYFRLSAGSLDLIYFERTVHNFFVNLGIPARVLASLYWQGTFFLGLLGTYYFTFRIQNLFEDDKYWLHSRRNRLGVLLLTLFFVFNPWTYERFLMGQTNVLRGHLFFVPVLFYLLRYLRTFLPSWNEPGDTHLRYFARFSWAITLLTLVSAHHAFFVFGLIAATLAYTFVWRVVLYEKSRTPASYFRRFAKLTSLTLLVLLPSMFLLMNRYGNFDSTQRGYFDAEISQDAEYKAQIIRSFSPIAAEGESLLEQVAIGGASWMTPSFIEPEEGREVLSTLQHLVYYYNPLLGWLFVLLMLAILGSLFYQADRHPRAILSPLLAFIPLSLLATFGYATAGTRFLNQLFYALPLSYTLRESGKFYSLFLALTLVFVAVYSVYPKKLLRRVLFATLGLAVFSNLLLFLPLRRTIPYLNFPSEMTTVVTDLCERENPNPQVLFYPFQTYIQTEGIDTYSAYPYRHLTPCPAFTPSNAQVRTPEDDTLTLYTDLVSQTVEQATTNYLSSPNTPEDYEAYKAAMLGLGVQILVIDSTHYPELAQLETRLAAYLTNAAAGSAVSIFELL